MEKKKLVSRAEIKQFIKDNDLKSVEDVQNVLKDLFAETLQEMLEAELDTTLGYEKNDGHNKRTNNRRNVSIPEHFTPPVRWQETAIPF